MFSRHTSFLVFSMALVPLACTSKGGPHDPADHDAGREADASSHASDGAAAGANGSGPANDAMQDVGSADVGVGGSFDAVAAIDGGDEVTEAVEAGDPGDGAADGDAIDVHDAAATDANERYEREGDATDANEGDEREGGATDAEAAAPADPAEVVYVATYLGGIVGYSIDDATGGLAPVPGSPFDRGAGFYAIGVAPLAGFVYAADYLRSNIDGYRVMRNGALSPLPGFPVKNGGAPMALAVDQKERFVFIGNSGEARLYTYAINRTTGALTPIADSPLVNGDMPAVLALDPSNRFLYISSDNGAGIRGFAIGDPSGKLTEMEGSPFGTANVHGGGIAFAPRGRLLYTGGSGISAFRYDDVTGVLTEIPGAPFGPASSDRTAVDIATDVAGEHLYAVSTSTQILSAYVVDQTTGRLTALPGSPFAEAPAPYSVGVEPSGRFVYVGDDTGKVTALSRDLRTDGGLLPVARSPFEVVGLQPEFAFVRISP